MEQISHKLLCLATADTFNARRSNSTQKGTKVEKEIVFRYDTLFLQAELTLTVGSFEWL